MYYKRFMYFLIFSFLLRKNANYLFRDEVHAISITFLTLKRHKILRPPKPPGRPYFPPSLIFRDYSGLFSQGRNERSVKVTIHPHLVLRVTRRVFTSTVCLHSVDGDRFTFISSFTLDNTKFRASISQNPQTPSKAMYTNLALDLLRSCNRYLYMYENFMHIPK
jgi:hypothetical protein